ncbi:hypothetical protein [Streptomyces parvus]|uniref:Uncharacterized protein n=1 Tax=Streptomyces parvus TaxID=66428 RepID=A0A7K3RZ62_9ACTN|nr:hypothetical protein [Streptomyces parvus]NEC20525.1 hypothetical protein [Streptomyces parvus]
MGVVVLYLSVSLLLSAPFGVAVWRYLARRPQEVPAPYARYRPERNSAVVLAELEVRCAYTTLAPLYEPPAPTGGVPR